MSALLKRGNQHTRTYTNASGTEAKPGDVVNVREGYDLVVVNLANDTVGQATSVAMPDGSADYTVTKDSTLVVVEGDVLVYDTSTNQIDEKTAAGETGCWVAIEAAGSGTTTVDCQHVIGTQPTA